MSRRFTLAVLVGMALGVLAGAWAHTGLTGAARAAAADDFGLLSGVFLRLIRMIIAPLVLSTLFVGVARMGGGEAVGRIGVKTLAWFLAASLLSLSLGLAAANLLNIGAGLGLKAPLSGSAGAAALTFRQFVEHVVPTSLLDAMARNEILQIVVFAVLAGLAAGRVGGPAEPAVEMGEAVAAVMLRVTAMVMRLAPLAVFGALASAIAVSGLQLLLTYAAFVGGFYATLAVLWLLMAGAARAAVGRRAGALFGAVREPVLIAFSTSTSEAAYPLTLERLEGFGVPNRIASFVLPLGYSFNLVGSMLYCTFAVLFIAQAYGVRLDAGRQAALVLMLMVTSKGIAGVPRAALVVITAALVFLRLPEAGVGLILGVDHFLDMGRAATNVFGNSLVAAAVAGSEAGREPDPLIVAAEPDAGPRRPPAVVAAAASEPAA